MATDGQNTSNHTAKRLSTVLRIFALLWTGLAALILASLVIFYWQGPATALGVRLVQFLIFVVPCWLLLLLCVLGLSVSLIIGRLTQSGGRVWPVLTGSLAVALAIIAMRILVAAICSQQTNQNDCLQVIYAYSVMPLCLPCLLCLP